MSTDLASDFLMLSKVPLTSYAKGQPKGAIYCKVILSPGKHPNSMNFRASALSVNPFITAVFPIGSSARVRGASSIVAKVGINNPAANFNTPTNLWREEGKNNDLSQFMYILRYFCRMKTQGQFSILILSVFLFYHVSLQSQKNYAADVNTFTGTGGHGHTFPGAVLPFGMVQLSPDSRSDDSWDGCGGYHYNDSLIFGFSHTHLSGTGCSDYGDFLIMPKMGTITESPERPRVFNHKEESASPGYYAVKLVKDKIDVELSVTLRTGIHKYTFHKGGKGYILIDLGHRNRLLESQEKTAEDTEGNLKIQLRQVKQGWAKRRELFATVIISGAVNKSELQREIAGNNKKTLLTSIHVPFDVKAGDVIYIKVALSSVDAEGADRNLNAELPDWNFEKVKTDARNAWNRELSKIEVTTNDSIARRNFYTALYHCLIHPSINSDVDNRYRGNDFKIHTTDHLHYTVFSLWDTFRALNPLLTLVYPERVKDIVCTFAEIYNESGLLPIWELAGNETFCMIGYHSASLIADAIAKGIVERDTLLLLNALKESANSNRSGIKQFGITGYLDVETESESVSKTLEYSYDDWCISKVAKSLGKLEDENLYLKRSMGWRNVFDRTTGNMRPRLNGGWYQPFDPFEVNNHFTEANSWQYSFFVPHDIKGLINISGGEKALENNLDALFGASKSNTGRNQADITGMVGQYAQGNEPSHHIAYLYNYIHAPQKAQKIIWKILHELYRPEQDGLCGNEDCGQMSAWFVLSSLGLYQVCPGNPVYTTGNFLFNEAVLHLPKQKEFRIKANRIKTGDHFIVSEKWNGSERTRPFLRHEDVVKGGTLEINFSETESQGVFGKGSLDFGEETKFPSYLEAPLLDADMTFRDSTMVTLSLAGPMLSDLEKKNYFMYYAVGNDPFQLYREPIKVKQTCTVRAYLKMENGVVEQKPDSSSVSVGKYFKILHPDWKVIYNFLYDPQYAAGGAEALIDGIQGDENWRKGFWQGFQGKDPEIIIDMGKVSGFDAVNVSVLQDSRSWIIFPKEINVQVSEDGKEFKEGGRIKNAIPETNQTVQFQNLHFAVVKPMKGRFVKLTFKQFGKLPEWHPGKGGDSFIFVDEVQILGIR